MSGGLARAPVIGVPLRPEARDGVPRRMLQNRAYVDALTRAGAVPLLLPLLDDTALLLPLWERCDGLVLCGGPDVEPSRYGQAARDDCHVTSVPEVDEHDLRLARWAVDDDRPLLAICRGMQVLNVAQGGTLWQDLAVQTATTIAHDGNPRDALVHALEVEGGTLLASLVGTSLQVNSIHHQAVRDLGDGIESVAVAPDGVVEGVEMPGRRFVVGVQCHPEELSGRQPWADTLFAALVDAARR